MKKIIIAVRGGLVVNVFANDETIEVSVLDYDNWKEASDKIESDYYQSLENETRKLKIIY